MGTDGPDPTQGPAEAGEARRRGDAASTRAALLAAARELFAAHGFDRTTVRAVAERAGVNQSLLFRHFGSKDGLFTAALSAEAQRLAASSEPGDLLGAALGRMFDEDAGEDLLYAVLRSPSHDAALDALQHELADPFRRSFVAAMAAHGVTGEDAALRADLLLAWLFGLGFARSVLAVPRLRDADGAVVTAHLERAARALLEAPPTPTTPRTHPSDPPDPASD